MLVACGFALAVFQAQVDAATQGARLRAIAAADDLERHLQTQLGSLRAIASAREVMSGDPAAMRVLFDRIDPPSVGFDGQLFWVDETGWLRARSDYAGPPLDFTDREWVKRVLATDAPWVSDVRMGQLNKAPIVVLAVPTHDLSGNHTGILAGAIRLDRIRSGAYDLGSAGGASIEIIDRTGTLVVGDGPLTELAPVPLAFDHVGLRRQGSGVVIDGVGPDGDGGRLIGFAGVPAGGWLVVVDSDWTAVLAPARRVLLQQLLLVGLIALLALAVVTWAAKRLRRAVADAERAYLAEHEARTELARLVDDLQARAEAGEAFVGVLSHELRTPVTTIYGMANVLRRSPGRDDRELLVEDIEEEAERLRRIVEDLLVISRVESGAMSLALEPVLVQRLVPTILVDLERRFPSVDFRLAIPTDLPPVAADEGAVRQVFTNLLSNAAKYGGGLPVTLAGRRESTAALVIEVVDRGPGIPDEDRERVFDLFYRSPGSSRAASGTGIGLYVVRRLVQAMGGRVDAGERLGGGTVLSVRLPVYSPLADRPHLDGTDRQQPAGAAALSGSAGRA